MQLDTDLSFADIHGSPNTMLASIKEIQTVALFRETTNWLTLRFLSRVEPQPKGAKQSGKITSVSRLWGQFPPSTLPCPTRGNAQIRRQNRFHSIA
jgi:hypothetical protein